MPRSLPPLNALRAFEAAGRHESFSGAAEELNVNHSAISRHVRGLEDRLGAQLFRDLPRGVALTQAGARYLAAITPALDRIAEATEVFHQRPAGQVTVDAEPLFTMKWLVPRLGDFYARFPDVELRLQANSELADLSRYEADVALRFFHAGPANQAAPLLSDAPLYPFAAPKLVPTPLSPEELLKLPLLRDRREDTWRHWARLAGCPPPAAAASDWRMRARLAYESALAGHGVILASSELAQTDLAEGRLVQCSDIGFRMGSYHLVLAEGVLRRSAVRLFRDWLLDQSAALRSGKQ
ncbi:LysR substrate-binding domain-containing protein [Cognatiyoonia sp. IB215446]|uniref:LysR substrate-binding domain-containing protein n=1 Tax=Cognatiyoonia sp. IB215446 TaxID=3097355 RepID=UPI002A155EEE|nr:LysR substrate-binding domain-containing protein [Cognatiyoonia sp. IB215446]MDX8347135.1 LysR substrate-binding domain-containing protein [Cognatiyoonia sp. IB215446]